MSEDAIRHGIFALFFVYWVFANYRVWRITGSRPETPPS